MTNILQKLAFATASVALSVAALDINPASAATLDFEVTPDVGPLVGETYSGSLSYDETDITGIGEEFIAVTDLDFNFFGDNYSETDGLADPEAVFFDGDFLGLTFSGEGFSFIAGFFDLSEAWFVYDIEAGPGTADITYKEPTTVPESSALLGLGLLGGGMLLVGKKVRSAKRR